MEKTKAKTKPENTQQDTTLRAIEPEQNWLYGKNITFEEQERRRRESRVQRLLTRTRMISSAAPMTRDCSHGC